LEPLSEKQRQIGHFEVKKFFTKIYRGVNVARKRLSEVPRALGDTTTTLDDD